MAPSDPAPDSTPDQTPDESNEGDTTEDQPTGTRGPLPTSRRSALATVLGLGGLSVLSDSAQAGHGGTHWRRDVDADGNTLFDLGALAMLDNETRIRDFAGANLAIDGDDVLNADTWDTVVDADGNDLKDLGGIETRENRTKIKNFEGDNLSIDGDNVLNAEGSPWEDDDRDNLLEAPSFGGIDVDFVQTSKVGTSTSSSFEGVVSGNRFLRVTSSETPNIIAGHRNNSADSDVVGSTIAGGGKDGRPNTIDEDYATIGGGYNNEASGEWATVPGGRNNTASAPYTFAGGRAAEAKHRGAHVWSDSGSSPFSSTGADQFLVNADGGVGIGTDSPSAQLDVDGAVSMSKVGLSAWLTSNQVITPSPPEETVVFDGINTDDFAGYDSSTGVYTVQRDGVYHVDFMITWSDLVTGVNMSYKLQINGSDSNGIRASLEEEGRPSRSYSKTLFGLERGDTLAVALFSGASTDREVLGFVDREVTYLTIHRVG